MKKSEIDAIVFGSVGSSVEAAMLRLAIAAAAAGEDSLAVKFLYISQHVHKGAVVQ